MTTKTQRLHRIVIAGGGFAGVRAARLLGARSDAEVTLITDHSHFAYYPQFYHSATGGSRSEVALLITDLLADVPVTLVRAQITGINPDARTITSTTGDVTPYDTLILALGSVTNYFGIGGLQEFSYDIKTIDGAERFKHHLHDVVTGDDPPEQNFVVVGGGPTGIELSAALGHYLRRIARLHHKPVPKFTIDVVEAAPRLLPRMSEGFAARIHRRLEKLGVTVLTGTAVKAETAQSLKLSGRTIATSTVVWTAGAANNPFYAANANHFTLGKTGKVTVDQHLQALPDVYVIGDNADTPYAGYAQTAIHDANFVAADVSCVLARHPRPVYHPSRPVNVIPVGRHWAATNWGRFNLYGYLGYMIRRAADLIGYADIETWMPALRVWLSDSRHDDTCRICADPDFVSRPDPSVKIGKRY